MQQVKVDIMDYFTKQKEMTPAFYYFKKRNRGVINFLRSSKQNDGFKLYGDLEHYFKSGGEFEGKDSKYALIKEVNNMLGGGQLRKIINEYKNIMNEDFKKNRNLSPQP